MQESGVLGPRSRDSPNSRALLFPATWDCPFFSSSEASPGRLSRINENQDESRGSDPQSHLFMTHFGRLEAGHSDGSRPARPESQELQELTRRSTGLPVPSACYHLQGTRSCQVRIALSKPAKDHGGGKDPPQQTGTGERVPPATTVSPAQPVLPLLLRQLPG